MSWRRARRAVDRTLEAVLAALMAAMVANVLWQVVTRFALRDPSSVTEELARFALIWIGLLGASYGFGRRLHLAIELLAERLGERRRRLHDAAVQALVALFALAVLVVGGGRLVQLTLALEQTSAALRVPLGLVYLVLPISGAIVLFYAVAQLVDPRADEREG